MVEFLFLGWFGQNSNPESYCQRLPLDRDPDPKDKEILFRALDAKRYTSLCFPPFYPPPVSLLASV